MKAVHYWNRPSRGRLAQTQPERLAEDVNRRFPWNRYPASLHGDHLRAAVHERVALLSRSLLTRRRMDSFYYTDTFHPRYLQYEDDIGQREVGQIADQQIELVRACLEPIVLVGRLVFLRDLAQHFFQGRRAVTLIRLRLIRNLGMYEPGNARVRPAEHRLGQPPCVLHL